MRIRYLVFVPTIPYVTLSNKCITRIVDDLALDLGNLRCPGQRVASARSTVVLENIDPFSALRSIGG